MAEEKRFEESLERMRNAAETGAKSILSGFSSALTIMEALSSETAGMGLGFEKGMGQAVSSMEPLVKGWQTATKAVEGYEKTQSLTQIASKGGLDVMQTGVVQGETGAMAGDFFLLRVG